MSGRFPLKNYRSTFLGKNLYEFWRKTSIILGSGDTEEIIKTDSQIRIIRVDLKHVLSNDKTDAVSGLSYWIYRFLPNGLPFRIARALGITDADIEVLFGERYEISADSLRIVLNGTATDKVQVMLLLQRLW